MKKLQTSAMFFAILLLTNCGSTTTEPTPDPVEAMVGSYDGDLRVKCKNNAGQTSDENTQKTYVVSRIPDTDSITIGSKANTGFRAKTNGSAFAIKSFTVLGETYSGGGSIVNGKLTLNVIVDANATYGYNCTNDFTGNKKAQ